MVQFPAVLVTFLLLGCIASGVAFAYMGFLLFSAGVTGSSDVDVDWPGAGKFVLRNAAPGTLFALLGAAITIFALWQGLSLVVFQAPTSQ